MVTLKKFKNLIDLLAYFTDEQVCREYLEAIRWPEALQCPYKECAHDKVFKFRNGKVYKCAKCKRQYSVRVGTIFEDSKIGLQKWFAAVYLVTSHKKGISSLQLHRDLGVTQKTAWYMLHRIRHTLGLNNGEKLSGTVEADETALGGSEFNKHKHKRTEGKQGRSTKTRTAVAGVIQRGGELRAQVVPNTSGENLRKFLFENVEVGSHLHTDEWLGYNGLDRIYKHSTITHREEQYVMGECHTNTLEGFWSLLKRGVNGIYGIYHSISSKHIQKYLDEFVFRYNTRHMAEAHRFDAMLNNIATTLPYKQLINKRPVVTVPFKPFQMSLPL